MTTRTMTHIAAAALGALVLAAAAPATGLEQLDKPARTAKADRGAATKPVKPAQRNASSPKAETPGRQWTLQDAMPDHSASMRYYAPENTAASGLGRVPLRSGPGTFGIATETKTRSDLLPDGRPIPSLDRSSRQTPSYVGLSLSVPTSDKALNIPVPFASPW
jgi:hypothetical protein